MHGADLPAGMFKAAARALENKRAPVMIVLDCRAGERQSRGRRLASVSLPRRQFSRIVTPGRQAVQERRTATWASCWPSGCSATSRTISRASGQSAGRQLEPDARKFYAFHRDADPRTVGFCYRDDARLVGASPDGLVGDDGLLGG